MKIRQIDLAEMQMIGFAHASKGHGIKSLASSMGLTKSEWGRLKARVNLKEIDVIELDEYFEQLNKE